MQEVDVIVIGAGASGMMCAATAGFRGRKVLLLDHSSEMGKKILIAGGGRCNFTNMDIRAENYISRNPHFCKSALKRFSPYDIIDLISRYNIEYEQRDHGQLFCRNSAGDILRMLLQECRHAGVYVEKKTTITTIKKENQFTVSTNKGDYVAKALVLATGGLSYPQIGASDLGMQTASQFGLPVVSPRPGLVPLTLSKKMMQQLSPLSGISLQATVTVAEASFTDALLFTHRGLSGPAGLQISNYWTPGRELEINLLPTVDLAKTFSTWQSESPKILLSNLLGTLLTKRLAHIFLTTFLVDRPVNQYNSRETEQLIQLFHKWQVTPTGTEGFEKAEVTIGGVDTRAISSKTFESQNVPGLYFTGEVLDVTGWLGGYNLHWAWASGFCAGQFV